MTERYARLREALSMGPTPGPRRVIDGDSYPYVTVALPENEGRRWDDPIICTLYEDVTPADYIGFGERLQTFPNASANAAHIAACDPDTIRELLEERDALRAENDKLRERVKGLERALVSAEEMSGQIMDDFDSSETRSPLLNCVSGLHTHLRAACNTAALQEGKIMSREQFEKLFPVPDDVQWIEDGYYSASLTEEAVWAANHHDSMWIGFNSRQPEIDDLKGQITELVEALEEAQKDLIAASINMRRAQKTDSRWDGVPEIISDRVNAIHDVLAKHKGEA